MTIKNNCKLTSYELETIINYNEEEKTSSVYTYNKALIKKLDNYCLKFPNLFIFEKQDYYGKHLSKSYIIPKKQVKITAPRILSEETKNKLANNLKRQISA